MIESNSEAAFNPASNVKLATAYAIIKTFGPDFRFMTNVYTDGAIDRATGTLNANIYVSGKDPIFGFPHAVSVANELNRLGVRSITGDLIVTDNFVMNYSGSSLQSGQTLFNALDASKRTPAATSAWLTYLSNSGQSGKVLGIPSVSFTGTVYVQPIPSSLHLLFTHESTPIREILKATLCYSNNFLAERFAPLAPTPAQARRLVVRRRRHGDDPAAAAGVELDHARPGGEDRVVAADAGARAGAEARAALPDEDHPRLDLLPVEQLDAQSLRLGVAAVLRGAETFLVCHR